MSQQGPGGYGGGGPYGPPGGGGYGGPPPGGGYPPPGGGPPGGYGPPGYGGPPAGGPPPGYGPPQQGYGYPGGPPAGAGGPPPKKSKTLLLVGLGCGALILLGVAGGIASYLYMKSKVNDAETAIANLADAGALGVPASGSAGAGSLLALSPMCAKAATCCAAMATKTSPASAPFAAQACAKTYATFADNVCAQQYASLKQAATTMGATCQ